MNIIIIGCGNIGFRHLESIMNIESRKSIYLIDNSENALIKCRDYINKNANLNAEAFYLKTIRDLDSSIEIDIAIISTSSNSRADLIKSLFLVTIPTHLILEKLLFSKISDFDKFTRFFETFNTKVWVNQWLSSEFECISNLIDKTKDFELSITGSNWGLCCNSVHFIEWFHSLVLREQIEPDKYKFRKILESKRRGYFEIIGKIELQSERGSRLILECNETDSSNGDININISNGSLDLSSVWNQDKLVGSYRLNNLPPKEFTQIIKYQSQRTEHVIADLISTGVCCLPSYKNSAIHHLLVYPLFQDFFLHNGFDLNNGIPIS